MLSVGGGSRADENALGLLRAGREEWVICMRQIFANRPVGLLALGVVVLLVLIQTILGGRSLLGGPTEQGTGDTAPDRGREAVTTPATESTERQEMKEQTTDQEAQKQEAEQAEREAAEEEAQRQAEEQAAAEQYAQEWAAVQAAREQAAQEQAAADQYAAEQAAIQESQEQIAAMDAEAQADAAIAADALAPVDSAELFPEAMAAPSSTTMYLTIPAIGLYDIPVVDDISEAGLSQGAGHLPGTGFPWIPGSNTYVAGHRLGYAGTPSDQVFYNLPALGVGDKVILTDGNGQSYTYAVSEALEVPPTDLSVTAPIPDRDVVTLQTCIEDFGDYWTPGPNWFARYVVRADRVA